MVEMVYSGRRGLNDVYIIFNIILKGFVFILMGGKDSVCSNNLSFFEG